MLLILVAAVTEVAPVAGQGSPKVPGEQESSDLRERSPSGVSQSGVWHSGETTEQSAQVRAGFSGPSKKSQGSDPTLRQNGNPQTVRTSGIDSASSSMSTPGNNGGRGRESILVDGQPINASSLTPSGGLLIIDRRTGQERLVTPPGWWEAHGLATVEGEIIPAVPDLPAVDRPISERVPGLVAEAIAAVGWPPITLGIAPPGIGLVGLPSHYWVQNYAGQTLGARAVAEIAPLVGPEVPTSGPQGVPADCPCRRPRPLAVEVFVHPARRYRWDFGDGSNPLVGTRGQPYAPGGRRSEVQHQYERSSRGHQNGYLVTVEVEFPVSYTVTFDGQTQTFDLGASTLRYAQRYPVQELQGVLLAPNAALPR